MSFIDEDSQRLAVGAIVELFALDLTALGGSVYYFTPTAKAGGVSPVFQGHTYTPVDIVADGFEVSGRGTLPTPTLRLANTNRALTAVVNTYHDLVGATVIRLRTLAKYLDGEPGADPNAHYQPDIFFIEQKTAHNKLLLEWKLAAAIDVEGQKLPRRTINRSFCQHIYRRVIPGVTVDEETFDYSKATCPYAGSAYFDRNDESTTVENDACSKYLTGCRLRFGSEPLPTYAFPGVGRLTTG